MVVGACNLKYLGAWGRRIAWAWEVEAAVSWDCAIALQPGWQTKILSQKYISKNLPEDILPIKKVGGKNGQKNKKERTMDYKKLYGQPECQWKEFFG